MHGTFDHEPLCSCSTHARSMVLQLRALFRAGGNPGDMRLLIILFGDIFWHFLAGFNFTCTSEGGRRRLTPA